MLNRRAKNRIYDLAQQLWVSTCLAVTVTTTGFLGYQLWHYFLHVKPIKKEMEERFKEELLKEGRMIRDNATVLK